jgi:hypothetical protein
MIFNHVVQQRRAYDVSVTDSVVADDPDRDPQKMIDLRLALPPVGRMQSRAQFQRLFDTLAIRARHSGDLDGQALTEPNFTMD